MLLHNLVPSSVEKALTFASNHGKDVLCEWVPAKSWKGCSERCEYIEDGSNLLINGDIYGIPESSGKSKRRKIQEDFITPSRAEQETEATTDTVKSFHIRINSDYVTNAGVKGAITKVDKCKEDMGKKSLDKENIFSVSKVEKGVVSTINRTKTCSIGECSNSELAVLVEDLSTRDICISFLKNHGIVVGDWPIITSASNKILEYNKDRNTFDSCELCGKLDNTLNMLLCDHCEEAFHVSCCNTKTKMLPTDEWFCQSCSKLDGKVSLEASFIKSKNISWLNGNPKLESDPIALMFKYPEAYVSRVRIGDSFQAAVPEWPDDVQNNLDSIGEPLELDLAVSNGLHGCLTDKFSKHNSTSNWLQCQEVLCHIGECVEGTICGKWRRAPLSEIQTDDWDCSCCVLWDPFHADCAVPQELETDEVLLQLKYIEQLRSCLTSKRKKIL